MTPLGGFAIITPSFHFDPPSILLSSPVKFMGNAGSINHVSFTINVLTLSVKSSRRKNFGGNIFGKKTSISEI